MIPERKDFVWKESDDMPHFYCKMPNGLTIMLQCVGTGDKYNPFLYLLYIFNDNALKDKPFTLTHYIRKESEDEFRHVDKKEAMLDWVMDFLEQMESVAQLFIATNRHGQTNL